MHAGMHANLLIMAANESLRPLDLSPPRPRPGTGEHEICVGVRGNCCWMLLLRVAKYCGCVRVGRQLLACPVSYLNMLHVTDMYATSQVEERFPCEYAPEVSRNAGTKAADMLLLTHTHTDFFTHTNVQIYTHTHTHTCQLFSPCPMITDGDTDTG